MNNLKSGTYKGRATGYHDYITVDVEVDGEKIVKINYSENETPNKGGVAVAKMVEEIIRQQSVEIDTVSGATYASEGTLRAVDYALGVARGERAPIDGEFNEKTGTIEHHFISGTYSGNGDGYKGEINLNVTVSENKIEKIEYQGKETADIGGKAIEDIIATILRSQSTQVDSISGATFSSRGTQEALDYALGIARGEIDPEAAPQLEDLEPRIQFRGGSLTIEQIEAILNTLPVEITFVGPDLRFQYFNEDHHEFHRSKASLGSHFIDCHPPHLRGFVGKLAGELAAGTRKSETHWFTRKDDGRKIFITYLPVTNRKGETIGFMEYVQNGTPFMNTIDEPNLRGELSDPTEPNPFAREKWN
ncbi:FMN-binding protein [Carnobacterium jeotgali]